MAYEKHTWTSGETIMPDLLNNIEGGVESNANAIDTINTNISIQAVSSSDDMNDFRVTGIFYGSPTNGKGNGWYIVLRGTDTVTKQICYRYGTIGTTDSNTWVRTSGTSGNFSDWTQIG